MRTTSSAISFMTLGRPPVFRRELSSHFIAMSFQYQTMIVFGVTRVAISLKSLKPTALPFTARRRRW